mmetsp:Transcript_15086/g.19724  ORF Transcript_15086/g.19724 Transcript_15086/m.19724 type:complete len:89 (-) Transcript_15086:275-541(-)
MSDSLETEFQAAAVTALNNLSKSLPNTTKIDIYSFFKQATKGDVTGARPRIISSSIARAMMYDGWKKLEGMSKEDSKQKYIDLIESLQ